MPARAQTLPPPFEMRTRGTKRALDAIIDSSKSTSKPRRVRTPPEPVIFDVPSKARFAITVQLGAKAKEGSRGTMCSFDYKLPYDDLVQLLDAEAVSVHKKPPRGSWEVTRTIDFFQRDRAGVPKWEFDTGKTWPFMQENYEAHYKKSQVPWEFRMIYAYTSMRCNTEVQSREDTAMAQEDNDDDNDNDNDTFLASQGPEDARETTPRVVRATKTSRQESEVSDSSNHRGKIMAQIKDMHACKYCSEKYCYNPRGTVPGRHCKISNAGLVAWANMVIQGRTTTAKPHDTLPEVVQYWKDFDIQVTPKANRSLPESPLPTTAAQIYYMMQGGMQTMSPSLRQENHDLQPQIPSSPILEEEVNELEMFCEWLDWTLQRTPGFRAFDPTQILANIESEFLGWHTLKETLRKPGLENYSYLNKSLGMPLGLCAAMHKQLYPWEESLKVKQRLLDD